VEVEGAIASAEPARTDSDTSVQSPLPAVVVGGSLNALGVVRSLSHGRMPIYMLETTRGCAAGWSRYCTYVPIPAHDGAEFVEALLRLGTRLACRPVLILTTDTSVNCVSEHRRELEPLFRMSLPSAEVVHTLADKIQFQLLAEREGFAVPRSVCVADAKDLAQLERLTPPLIVKPADKTLVLSGVADRAVYTRSIAEARSAGTRMLERAHRIIFQEWVDGPDTDILFTLFSCDDNGAVLGLFPGRKLVCTPPAMGNTAVCVAAPEVADELTAPTLEFIRRVNYRGLGSMEFKRDRHSGRLFMIEPTVGRTDWQEEIATLCGVNLPLMTYCCALGQRLPAANPPSGSFAWRSSAGFRASLPHGVHAVDGYFRSSDPLPALYYYGYERIARRLWRKAVGSSAR
jgi:predicted ATP-grasp superfamily ATP-dependent carboligase